MKFILSISFLLVVTLGFTQPTSWSSRGIGGGGALFSPSINPANGNEYYISCDMTELFHTTDFGLNYTQAHHSQFVGGHYSKVCFTNVPGLLYSIRYINEIPTPCKSTDNGLTWSSLSGNPYPSDDVYTIHVDFNNTNRIVISFYNEIYFSSNGGTNFNLIHNALSSGSGNVIGGAFFDGNNIYLGTNDGVLYSSNSGSTWQTMSISGLPANDRIWSFCAAKSGGVTRFFCLTASVNDIYVGIPGSDYWGFYTGIYSCDVGITNWVPKNTGISANDFPMYIDMAENDINTVYIAGSNTSFVPIVMKTTNAGSNWSHTFLTTNNQNISTGWSGHNGDRGWWYGECPFGFDVSATNKDILIFGDFGFVHKSNTGGSSWQQAYVATTDQHAINTSTPKFENYHSAGLENTTCWQVHWVNPTSQWACYSDIRGIRSIDSGESWSFNYTGHEGNSSYRVVQGSNGTMYMATSGVHDMYQSTRLQDNLLDANDPAGKILYSTNGGQSWQNLHVFNHPVFWIALDPNNANRAYASVIHYFGGIGAGGIYRCDDIQNLGTSTWTLLPDPPRTQKHPAAIEVLNDAKVVCTYSGRRTSGGAFTASSGVFLYDPVTNLWGDKSHAGMNYWTKDIVIDPYDPTQNTWFACVFSGWGGAPNGLGGLYKTTNRGTSWVKLTGNTLDRVTSCTFNPDNYNQIFITTEAQGLWMSSNIRDVTPIFTPVNSYPFRQPERVFFNPYNDNEMWVTSFGNGMKKGYLDPCKLPLGTTSVFVDATKQNSGQGTSWNTAFRTFGEALQVAWQCPDLNNIYLAEGTYKPDYKPYQMGNDKRGSELITNDNRDVTFHIRPGLEIYGGFPSGGGLQNYENYPTILSGNLGNGTYAYHVVLLLYNTLWGNINDITVLDGCLVQDGNADTNTSIIIDAKNISRWEGGGVNVSSGKYQVSNNIFHNNVAYTGGAIYITDAEITWLSNDVMNNSAALGTGIFSKNTICNFGINNNITGITFEGGSATFTNDNVVK